MITNILYIEDDEGLQSLVGHTLRKSNYQIRNVSSLSEAKDVFKRDTFDIVLVDYELPDGKGIEFIQENNKKAACIILTGAGNEKLVVKCMREGARDYIVKDFQGEYLEILPNIIDRVLSEIKLENESRDNSEKLLKTQSRLQAIFDNAPDLMVTTDSNFNIINVSDVTIGEYKQNKILIENKHLNYLIGEDSVREIEENKNTFIRSYFYNEIPVLVKCIALNSKENLIVFRSLSEQLKAQKAIDKLKEKNQKLESVLRCYSEKKLLGQSKEILKLRKIIQSVAMTEATVIISGETGTGKELVADAIVRLSCRSEKPMVTLNCASIPKELVESVLFGHEKGAFTGALKQYDGKFSQADGGTIFLDEVGELDIDTQAKLLRILQEGEVQPVGSQKTKYVDVRIIAATNRNLEDMVARNLFREDLFYRLNVLPIVVPALRNRKDDIVLLAQYYMNKYAQLYRMEKKIISSVEENELIDYPWPGNVRELQNVMERFLVLGRMPLLTPPEFFKKKTANDIGVLIDEQWRLVSQGCKESEVIRSSLDLRNVEKNHIEEVLSLCGWVVSGEHGAAKKLGLNPSTLRFKIKKLNIKNK